MVSKNVMYGAAALVVGWFVLRGGGGSGSRDGGSGGSGGVLPGPMDVTNAFTSTIPDPIQGGVTGDSDTSVVSEGFTRNEDTNIFGQAADVAGGALGDPNQGLIGGGLTGDSSTNAGEELSNVVGGGVTGDEDTNVIDEVNPF